MSQQSDIGSEKIHQAVRQRYAKAAKEAGASCCSPEGAAVDLIGRSLYGEEEADELPEGVLAASLGCGNPTLHVMDGDQWRGGIGGEVEIRQPVAQGGWQASSLYPPLQAASTGPWPGRTTCGNSDPYFADTAWADGW